MKNNKFLTNLISNNYKICFKILSLYFNQINAKLTIPPYFKLLNRLIEKNGLTMTVSYLKQCRLHVTRFLCGQPLFVNKAGVSVDKEG